MASRPDAPSTINKLAGRLAPSPSWSAAGDETQVNALRPLSDIREITEPSLMDSVMKRSAGHNAHPPLPLNVTRQSSLKRANSVKRYNTVKIVEPRSRSTSRKEEEDHDSSNTSSAEQRECSSIYSIPPSSVPIRASSHTKEPTRSNEFRLNPSPQQEPGSTVPDRGQSHSPVKQAQARLDPVSSDASRAVPTKTFARSPCSVDIVENPTQRHSRVRTDLQIIAPVFVGGGSVEGYVRVYIDDADRGRQRRDLELTRIAVDLLGVEELVAANRKNVFLSLATELLDGHHPPPGKMVKSTTPRTMTEPSWTLVPSFSMVPFRVSLPLDTGPPPFQSKNAKIKYLLCATLVILDSGRSYSVRCSQELAVLPTYDPEKALRSLPSPLTAHDELAYAKSGELETIKITAGLHRQVWVSGTSIFVDVHIVNSSHKRLKKLELSIERDVLCYRHAPAATLEQSAGQARMFQDKDQSILSKSQLKQATSGWNGVEPWSTIVRTCDVELPRGHATVRCGKYFEVRFFLNITLGTSHSKMVMVQLPIILIHMNSLDVVPNAVHQVATAIEQKRSRRHHSRSRRRTPSNDDGQSTPRARNKSSASHQRHREQRGQASHLQGRAFAAPRQQSLDRRRADQEDVQHIGQVLERSPRKHHRSKSSKATISPKMIQQDRNRERPRRPNEIHKTASSLSLGGMSVGSYTIFNSSHLDSYTPPRTVRHHRVPDPRVSHEVEGARDRLRNLRSFESLRSFTGKSDKYIKEERLATKKERERLQRDRGYAISSPSLDSNDEQGPQRTKTSAKGKGKAPELGPISLGPHSLGLHGNSGSVPPIGLGLTSHVRGQRVDDDESKSTTVKTGYGYSVRDPHGHILTAHPSSSDDNKNGSLGTGVVRRASLKLREQMDKSRFEFKAVAGRHKDSNTVGGTGGALKTWFGNKTSRSKSRERDRIREGWI